MSDQNKYPRDLLTRTAATSTSLVDLLRRLGAPLGSRPLRYVRDRLKLYGIDTTHFVDEALPERQRRSYTRELLEEAAIHAHSIREMLEYMNVPPDDGPYGHIRKRLDRLGIDTSHFTDGRRYGPPLTSRHELASAIGKSKSMAGVLEHLGHTNTGAARARLERSLAEHGLSTAHFTGQGHTRGSSSPHRKAASEILQRRESGAARTRTTLLRRALDEIGRPRVCSACGIGDTWQGKRLVLEIDHINGDHLDNCRENLRYLCPSCHSQTATFSKRRRYTQYSSETRARTPAG
ncbi:HNH endonuclease signature motif containing protein [Streptomyces griseus]|uniref:HNH endonuclease signature motif containing protein n=1 Tax=Streptomyces griseus TaxID=1911 RepID=UPI0009A0FBD8|nr:HNH endonuclease [Streptomyces griseus]